LIGQQWGLRQIGAASGWGFSTGAGVLVGVVDTGVDLNHEDLAGRIAATTNCIGANANPSACKGTGQDDNGHGTHVAGTIAADREYAWAHGAVPVLAAGNNAGGLLTGLGGGIVGGLLGSNAAFGNLHAIIVGATGPTGAMAPYSSLLTNDQWAVAAPGGANDG